MRRSPWLQPLIIVILAATLGGMTTFALAVYTATLTEIAAERAARIHEEDRIRDRLERLEGRQ